MFFAKQLVITRTLVRQMNITEKSMRTSFSFILIISDKSHSCNYSIAKF